MKNLQSVGIKFFLIRFGAVCCFMTFFACGGREGRRSDSSESEPLRILMVADPMALAFERSLQQLRQDFGE